MMDLTLILTAIGAVIAIIAANIALISWIRGDLKLFEIEMKNDMKSFKDEIRTWKDEIYKEMKDFHGRLCSLESKTHNKKDGKL